MKLYLIAGGIACTAMFAAYQAVKTTAVTKERVRVETEGKKTDAKAQKARAAAAADPNRVLSKYYRD